MVVKRTTTKSPINSFFAAKEQALLATSAWAITYNLIVAQPIRTQHDNRPLVGFYYKRVRGWTSGQAEPLRIKLC